jgi:hypothetical protein
MSFSSLKLVVSNIVEYLPKLPLVPNHTIRLLIEEITLSLPFYIGRLHTLSRIMLPFGLREQFVKLQNLLCSGLSYRLVYVKNLAMLKSDLT